MTNNLKNRILKTLNNKNNVGEIPPILIDLKKIQNKILIDYKNSPKENPERDELIKNYHNAEKIGKSLYRYKALSDYNITDAADTEAQKTSELLLKGGISNFKFIWNTEPNACDTCETLDGTVFGEEGDIPNRPHPNCKCYVTVSQTAQDEDDDDEPCDCGELIEQLKEEIYNAVSLKNQLVDTMYNLFGKIKTKGGNFFNGRAQDILDRAAKWDNALGDFARNYNDMVEADTIDGDKYFHAKANCQAAQRGLNGEFVAIAMSLFRELEEGTRKVIFQGEDLIEQIEDASRDMDANKEGREQGKSYPGTSCGDLLKYKRPNGLPERYW